MLYVTQAKTTKGTTVTVRVGAGGAGSTSSVRATNGSNSLLLGLGGAPVIDLTNYAGFFPGSTSTATNRYFVTSSASAVSAMGTGNFTLEGWMYLTGNGSGGSTGAYRTLFSTRATSATSSTTAFSCGINPAGGMYFFSNTLIFNIATSQNLENTWHHFAIVRNGTTLTCYVDGVSVASGTNSDNYTANQMYIGADADGSESWEGFLSNMRVTKGVAVYTGQFTVPAQRLQATQSAGTNVSAITAGQCSLLTLRNSTITDESGNSLTMTTPASIVMLNYNADYLVVNAIGGGSGGSGAFSSSGADGGSGGGAGNGGTKGLARSGQGNAGGAATLVTASPYACAGGGGAGGAATDCPNNSTGTAGGIGLWSTITGTPAYYAGGGNGCGITSASNGSLYGGGGIAASTASGTGAAGSSNTGGGGGGSAYNGSGANNGGSGIIIIKVLTSLVTATTGSPSTIVSGSYTIYTFNSSGTITF
jgi:hypothetical protein